jgi:soluble lytic murein transglycosylase-like protein
MADAKLRILISAATEDVRKSIEQLKQDFGELSKALKEVNASENTGKLAEGMTHVTEAVHKGSAEVKEHGEHLKGLKGAAAEAAEAMRFLAEAVQFVAGGFLAIEAVHMVKEVLDVAARTETLGIVLRVVGNNAGYTSAQLRDTDKAVQKLGITAEASRQSLAQLIQAGISLDLAKPLARASQDLAVITGVDSSETFKRLVTNIQQMDTLGLRFMGIVVDKERAIEEAAALTGRAISSTAEKQIFANAVLAEASKLAGTYEAAMSSVGKQLTSFPRYVEEFKDALGELGQNAYYALVVSARDILQALTELFKSFEHVRYNTDLFGDSAKDAADQTTGLAGAIRDAGKSIVEFIDYLKEHHEVIEAVGKAMKIALEALVAWGVVLVATSAPVVALGGFLYGLIGTMVTGGSVALALSGAFRVLLATLGPVGIAIAAIVTAWELYNAVTGHDEEHDDAKNKSLSEQAKNVYALRDAVNELIAAQQEQVALADKIKAAQARQVTARTPEETTSANTEAASLLAQQKKVQDSISKTQQKISELKGELSKAPIEDETLRAVAKQASDLEVAIAKQNEALKRFRTDLAQALKDLGLDTGQFEGRVNTSLSKGISNVKTLIEAVEHAGYSARDGLNTALKGIEGLVKGITTSADLAEFQKTLDYLRDEATKKGLDYSGVLNALAAQAQQAYEKQQAILRFGGEAAYQEVVRQAKRQSATKEAQAKQDLELLKTTNEQAQQITQAYFDKGLITLNEFTQRRLDIINSEAALEIRGLSAAIEGKTVAFGLEFDKAKKEQLQRDIVQLQGQVKVAVERSVGESEKALLDQIAQRIKLEEQAATIRQNLNTATGNEEAAIAEKRDEDLKKQLEGLGQLKNAEDERNAKLLSEITYNKAILQLMDSRIQKETAFKTAQLDLRDAQLQYDVAQGKLTSADAQTAQNALIAARISLLQDEHSKTQKLLDDYLALNKEGDATWDPTKVNDFNQKLEEQQTKIVNLAAQIKGLGKDLEDTFVNSLSDNLTAVFTGKKGLKQAVKDFFGDLNNQVVKSITKDWAEQIKNALNGGAEGGNFFDNIMGALLGKPGKPDVKLPKSDGSEARPYYTKSLDVTKSGSKVEDFGTLLTDANKKLEEIAANTRAMAEKAVAADKKAGEDEVARRNAENTPKATGDLSSVDSKNARKDAKPFDFSKVQITDKQGNPLDIDAQKLFNQSATNAGLDKYGIDANLLGAIASKESNFNAGAVSPKGAQGLFQFMPATFAQYGEPGSSPFDPKASSDAAAKYLKYLMDHFGGDLDKALAGYNWGEGNVDKAVQKFGDAWMDHLPKETADYVAKLGTHGAGGTKPSDINTPKIDANNPLPVNVVEMGGIKEGERGSWDASHPKTGTDGGDINGGGAAGLLSGNDKFTVTYDAAGRRIVRPVNTGSVGGSWDDNHTPLPDSGVKPADQMPFEGGIKNTGDGWDDSKTTDQVSASKSTQDSTAKTATATTTVADVVNKAGGTMPVSWGGGDGAPLPVKVTNFSDAPAAGSTGTKTVDATGTPTDSSQKTTDDLFRTPKDSSLVSDQQAPGFGDLLSVIGKGSLPYLASAVPGVGPILALAPMLLKFGDGLKNFGASPLGKLFGAGTPGSTFTPNADGVPRQGAYTPFEQGFPEGTDPGKEFGTDKMFSDLKDNLSTGFEDIASNPSDLGITDFFSTFGGDLSDAFSQMGDLLGGFGGGGGGGGGAGLLAGLFEGSDALDFAALFAEDGGYLVGPSHAGGGIAVEAEGGEYIINKNSTRQWLPLLHMINEGTMSNLRIPTKPHFADGGLVTNSAALTPAHGSGKVSPNVTVVQHITTPDANSFRRNQDQLAVDTSRSVNRALRRNT